MKRGFSALRDLPAMIWLLAIFVAAFAHPVLPEPRWLLIHLLFLGAVTHSIVVWSQHFADTLLHVPPKPAPALLALLNLGALTVMVGTQLANWHVVLGGAIALSAAVIWHGFRLVGSLRRALPSRFSTVVRFYVTAAVFLPIGATLGVFLAKGLPSPWHEQILLAHVSINVLGWVGLTVAGTVVTLWPTMLRTKLGEGSEIALRRALPIMAVGVGGTAIASSFGLWPLAALMLAAYVLGLALLLRPLVEVARRRRPHGFPAWSVAAGLTWLVGGLIAWVAMLALGGDAEQIHHRFGALVPYLATGFAAQVLIGALGHLIPMALGGGGRAVRAASTQIERGGAWRIVAVNLGLLVCLLPVPSAVRVTCSLVVLLALAAQLPLLIFAIKASVQARKDGTGPDIASDQDKLVRRRQVFGSAIAGLSTIVVAIAAGIAFDPSVLAVGDVASASANVKATGQTTTVKVKAVGMRFEPSTIEVPAGNRLVIEVFNDDPDVHDLVLETGATSGRLGAGKSAKIDVGVVGRDLDGWCSIVGHRQMGMTLKIKAIGGQSSQADSASGGHSGHHQGSTESSSGDSANATYDHSAKFEDGFVARDARLKPLTSKKNTTHKLTFTVSELQRQVAPGVTQRLWTYNRQAPGPVLHGRVGDKFVITLVNDGTIGHSIDFHAGALAPDRPMRTIAPGESLTYTFTATRSGIWMYHCSTMPMSVHIANGMFGAVVIEPEGLDPVDESYLFVQSEQFYGPQGREVDADKVMAETPDAVVFNGIANQYDFDPIQVRAGDKVRVWVLNVGPNRTSAFHVVGGQFSTVWSEGDYLLRNGGSTKSGGSQVLGLVAAQGGFVELQLDEPGRYPFVSHVMVDAERGAHGFFQVAKR